MIQTVKLAKLVLSDINVRTRGEDLIEQFAADISARGILQNLVVASVKKPRGSYGVIAGSRRFRALKLLAERGEINEAEYDVPVLILTGSNDELSEASLAENFHHLNMSPADECRAFQHCLGQGGDIDAVAKRFGITRRFVEGRLRLANLAEPIFEALRSSEMTLDMAKAYASTESHERQLMVWNSYGANSDYVSADTIRRVIANESMKSTDPVARLVGEEAYTAAGGKVDRDLFSDNGDRWTNPEIAQTLAAAAMEAEAKRIGEERGLAWIRPVASNSAWEVARGLFHVHLPSLPLSEAQTTRISEIEARLSIVSLEMENEELEEEAWQALDAEQDALNDKLRDAGRREKILPPELAPRVGLFLTLSQDGTMQLGDTYYSEAPLSVTMVEPDEGDDDADETGEGDAEDETVGDAAPRTPTFRIEEGETGTITGNIKDVAPDEAAPGGKALSQVLLDQLSVQRRDVLGASMIANPSLALDYMLFVMADERTGDGDVSGTSIRASHPDDPVRYDAYPKSVAHDYLAEVREGLDASWKEHKDKIARFDAFRALSDDTKAAWLAWIVAKSFKAKEPYTTRQNALQNHLAGMLEIDVAKWWRPTSENFFDRVPKGALLTLLDEVGGPALSGRHASQKKGEISTSCEKLFAGDAVIEADVKEKALAWVPAAMRFTPAETTDQDEGDEAGETGEANAPDEAEDDLASLIGEALAGPDDGDDGENVSIDDEHTSEGDDDQQIDDGSPAVYGDDDAVSQWAEAAE
ncbi:ParB/RepB/Spo0J family partition protein [Novosphingobium sp. BL-52-GroH]|uniref:ParB/RepB/Spo0J family partition protein n=1 Tax=Novosphingobium sp. BL-52-GroH TaxID=3349877 RepID=UPI00384FF5AD